MLCVLNSSSNSLFSSLYFPIFPLLSETSTSPSKFSIVSLKIFHILNFQVFFFFWTASFQSPFFPPPLPFWILSCSHFMVVTPWGWDFCLRLDFLFPLCSFVLGNDAMRFSSCNCCLLTVYSTLSEVIKSCLKSCAGGREGIFWYLVGFSTRQNVASFVLFFLIGTVPP